MRILSTASADFEKTLGAMLVWEDFIPPEIADAVAAIINDVRTEGDGALIRYAKKFDNLAASSAADLKFEKTAPEAAFEKLDQRRQKLLRETAKRISDYHQKQYQKDWHYRENDLTLGQKITPLERVGIYVPGGKAAYPSSVLMGALPAKIAGVKTIIMTAPAVGGVLDPLVLAAAFVAGVDEIFKLGGAHAIAALAHGTETIPKVDKIVGPGNVYVAAAKRAVFGQVGIDMVAGPSEIVIISDGSGNPDWAVMDLFSQAEHDENARAVLISPDMDFLTKIDERIEILLPKMRRKNIIKAALKNRGALIHSKNLAEAAKIVNRIAPEHLELMVENPENLLAKIHHAGAIFLGRDTCEAMGDYCAGPNHILPTAGTARFSSPLGVYDFQKKSSVIMAGRKSAVRLAKIAADFAGLEGLDAHAEAAKLRIK